MRPILARRRESRAELVRGVSIFSQHQEDLVRAVCRYPRASLLSEGALSELPALFV